MSGLHAEGEGRLMDEQEAFQRALAKGAFRSMSSVPKPRKYRNQPTVVDGHRFASKLEARRYGELRLLERAGEIVELTVQPRYELVVNGLKIGTYVADFSYSMHGMPVTEDAKGYATPEFRLKARLFRALYGRDIQIVRDR